MEQGRLDEAGLVLHDPSQQTAWEDGPRHAFHLAARGRLHHLRGEHDAAVEDLLESGRRLDSLGVHNPAVLPWRSRAAIAAAGAGERARAMSLAAEEVSLARTFGAARPLGVALRAAALVGPAEERLAGLREAVEVLERSPGALDRARALIDLGTELRRTGRRRDARESLKAGLDLAQRCEASMLEARGREELTAAGARLRRQRLSGSEALTPRERQVAQLAARGVREPRHRATALHHAQDGGVAPRQRVPQARAALARIAHRRARRVRAARAVGLSRAGTHRGPA